MLNTLYVPYPNFYQSIVCYSDDTLRSTLLTLRCTFNTLRVKEPSRVLWEHHAIWKAWHSWPQAYIHFAQLCFDEADTRGIDYLQIDRRDLARRRQDGRWQKPLWVGWDALHAEHRANLRFQGLCEQILKRICMAKGRPLSVHDRSVDDWLDARGFPPIYNIDDRQLLAIDKILGIENAPIPKWPNHYDQFNWVEEATCYMTRVPLGPDQEYLC